MSDNVYGGGVEAVGFLSKSALLVKVLLASARTPSDSFKHTVLLCFSFEKAPIFYLPSSVVFLILDKRGSL
jgi:hypothetical protein